MTYPLIQNSANLSIYIPIYSISFYKNMLLIYGTFISDSNKNKKGAGKKEEEDA